MSASLAEVREERSGKSSPYLAARDEWNERYRDLILAARNWRLLAVTSSMVALVAVLGLIVIGAKPKVIPYIVAVDSLGKVAGQGTAVQAPVADDRLKRAALWSWVQDWRMVSSDATVEKNAIERVYAEIGNGTPAATRISDAYRDGSPLKLAQTETVSVNVRALYASSKDSYEIEWTETTFDLKGEQIGTQNYKGVITISIHPPEDEGLARVNPLGIYVTNVSWSKVL
jgi:type IV secretion system protein VirB5